MTCQWIDFFFFFFSNEPRHHLLFNLGTKQNGGEEYKPLHSKDKDNIKNDPPHG